MAEEDDKSKVKDAGSTTDAAVVQIREVVKWLIGGFAAVGVALAAGSQLSEVGDLEGGRLIVAFASVFVVLLGIAAAILYATKVLTPKPVSLKHLVAEASDSEVGRAVADDPTLLLGHGNSIPEFAQKRREAVEAEDAAWAAYEAADAKASLEGAVKKATTDRQRIDKAMGWLFSYARYTEVSSLFKTSLRVMFVSAAVAAVGIAGFAWAAHPEDEKNEEAVAVVAKAPAKVNVDLSAAGEETLKDDLGEDCNTSELPALAVAGTPEALDVVTIPSKTCELDRFVLTPDLGTFENTGPPPTRSNPDPTVG
ncbi:MAG TPA: hypothetical protein VIM28_00535 [Solirubrobacterales bacterium]